MANRKIAYTLGRGRAYIFDMSSTSGYMGEKYFQEFGPRFFDMSSASGYMGETYFQEFGPRFLACHAIFGVSYGVSISIVSISYVSCRVRILRVSVSMPCRGHLALRHVIPEFLTGHRLQGNEKFKTCVQESSPGFSRFSVLRLCGLAIGFPAENESV